MLYNYSLITSSSLNRKKQKQKQKTNKLRPIPYFPGLLVGYLFYEEDSGGMVVSGNPP